MKKSIINKLTKQLKNLDRKILMNIDSDLFITDGHDLFKVTTVKNEYGKKEYYFHGTYIKSHCEFIDSDLLINNEYSKKIGVVTSHVACFSGMTILKHKTKYDLYTLNTSEKEHALLIDSARTIHSPNIVSEAPEGFLIWEPRMEHGLYINTVNIYKKASHQEILSNVANIATRFCSDYLV